MSSEPWWRSEPGPDDDEGAGAAAGAGAAGFDAAALQETVAGGLALVASFLRAATADEPPTEQPAEPEDPPAPAPDADAEAPHQHLAGPCRSCPVCQGLALLAEVRPDLVDTLGDVLEGLTDAVRAWSRGEGGDGGPR